MHLQSKVHKILRDKSGATGMLAVGAIIAVIIATAFAMIVGAIILSQTYDVADTLVTTDAGDPYNRRNVRYYMAFNAAPTNSDIGTRWSSYHGCCRITTRVNSPRNILEN